jgi:hypothetical protein
MIRRSIDHGKFERIVVHLRGNGSREREGLDVKVGELHDVLVPKDENPTPGAHGGPLSESTEAEATD